MLVDNVISLIGDTPLLRVNKLMDGDNAQIFIKLEKFNPGGSVKDRAALGMIEQAENLGILKKGDVLIEPTSGNTGIGIAMVGMLKGYKVIIVMPDSMSKERRDAIKAYGAELILTEGSKGMKGAIEKAEELVKTKGYLMLQQFKNIANANKHYETTAEEIVKDIPDIDIFVAGVGTSGTICGVGKRLKEINPNIKIIAIEPEKSPVLSGGKPGAHKIQGIGAGFIPDIYDKNLVDEIITVNDEDAFKTACDYARKEGILIGISSGAALYGALNIAKKLDKNKKIVVMAPDGGEKYFSMNLYE